MSARLHTASVLLLGLLAWSTGTSRALGAGSQNPYPPPFPPGTLGDAGNAVVLFPDGGTGAGARLTHPVDVRAERLHVDDKKHVIVWIEHVKAVRQDVTLTCDKLTGYYAGKDNNITRMTCDGHVVVVEPTRWGRGQHADFDNVNNVLVVTGNPEAYQGMNRFDGDKVIFYVGTDQLEAEHGHALVDSAAAKQTLGAKKSDGGTAPTGSKPKGSP